MDAVDFSNIDAYLFDLGGVIVDISPKAAIEAFGKLGLMNLEEQITMGHHNGLFKQYELGSISTTDFIESIQQLLPHEVGRQEIVDAWKAMLVHLPSERVGILEKLKAEKPVYLLSNTNEIHREAYVSMADCCNNIEPLFTKAFYSYEINYSKPDLKSFECVVKSTGLVPERTLFLDDSQLNLDAAKKMGFQTFLVGGKQTMETIFSF